MIGQGNAVEAVTSDRYCDEAVTIEGYDAKIDACHFIGHTTDINPGDDRCHRKKTDGSLLARTCGFDKAIQVNFGPGADIHSNTVENARAPILVNNGDPEIYSNTFTGFAPGTTCGPPFNCNDPDKG